MDFDSLYTILIEGREIASYNELKNNYGKVSQKILDYISNNSSEDVERIYIFLGNLFLVYYVQDGYFEYQIRSRYRDKLNQAIKDNSYPFSYDYYRSTFSNLPKKFSATYLKDYLNEFLKMDTYISKDIDPLIYSGPVVDDEEEGMSDELVPRFLRNLNKNKRNFQQLGNWIKSKIK